MDTPIWRREPRRPVHALEYIRQQEEQIEKDKGRWLRENNKAVEHPNFKCKSDIVKDEPGSAEYSERIDEGELIIRRRKNINDESAERESVNNERTEPAAQNEHKLL